ncbi:TetR/AcrR family transcriptional regulator [Nocardia sp. NBC_00881]|uniref:TetR/AcrR family transcriptional regulator n=1 Tax=Nocardia sp. NBC_00881 TaxID=2975995 RepID=UPI00386333A9|nr:TetR/AcrR family transcriptional regulator [Nocardia sp. NBC_00881]
MTEPMSPASAGRRLRRDCRRAQIIAAAEEAFALDGYHATSMENIAARARVSKPALYQHFPGKLELYPEVLGRQLDALVSAVRGALCSTSDNRTRVRAAVEAYFDFVEHGSWGYRLVFESHAHSEPRVRRDVDRATKECIDAVCDLVAGDARRARLLAGGVVGATRVNAQYWSTARGHVPKAAAIEMTLALCWGGISSLPATATT